MITLLAKHSESCSKHIRFNEKQDKYKITCYSTVKNPNVSFFRRYRVIHNGIARVVWDVSRFLLNLCCTLFHVFSNNTKKREPSIFRRFVKGSTHCLFQCPDQSSTDRLMKNLHKYSRSASLR